LCELTDGSAQVDYPPRVRRLDRCVGKVELRLVALGLGLREARNRAVALCLQRLDLPLCQLEGRLRTLQ
jgi:hypothetical protein